MSYSNKVKSGTDHTIWIKGLEFYRDELDLMQKRLQEVSAKNNVEESRKGVEHFQNQFMIQQKNISDLKHAVRNFRNELGAASIKKADTDDPYFINQGNILQEKYEQLELIMNSLRYEFNEFLSKWL